MLAVIAKAKCKTRKIYKNLNEEGMEKGIDADASVPQQDFLKMPAAGSMQDIMV